MAMKTLTIADVLKDQIDAKAFEAPTEPKGSVKKAFRTKTGEYTGEFKQTWIRESEAGRKSLSILVRLENEEGRFRGNTFAKVSWQLVTKADGTPDRQFKLFQQIIQVIGAPASAKLNQVLGAIEGERVKVFATEYFDVPAPVGSQYATTRVYINDETEGQVEEFLKLGYESKADIQRISSI